MKSKVAASWLIVILSVIGFVQPATHGQALGQPQFGSWDAVKAIPTGERVEINLKSGRGTSGKVKSVTDTEMTLLRDGRDTSLRREDISRVHHTVDKSSKKPMLVGAAAGGIVGIGIGAAVRDKATVKSAVPILLTGGATAAIGALIGWAIRGEKSKVLIYQSQ